MFILYGTRTKRIKKYVDTHVKCEECGSYTHIFEVYHDYFHVFFIPFVPYGVSRITSYCHKCGSHENGEKRNFYLEQTRKPKYLYSGFFLIAALFVAFVVMGLRSDSLEKEYIDNPAIGDVYLVKDDERMEGFMFMKVKDVKDDGVYCILNAFVYNRFVSRFDKSDFFQLTDPIFISKENLKKMHDKNIIRSVERNYNSRTGFDIEKTITMEDIEMSPQEQE